MRSKDKKNRIEFDALGPVALPLDAYYGAATARARENFKISSYRFPRVFIHALGLIKWAAARANRKLGVLNGDIASAVEIAADEVVRGTHDSQFCVDIFQTGSGTSTNMNANEVIANRASELLGGEKGRFAKVHPNDHVNRGQSSNDVIPTAAHLACCMALQSELLPALNVLSSALKTKEKELWHCIKTGRTHLQDALPIRLGQEFKGYCSQIELSCAQLRDAQRILEEVALGGTAIGTGAGTHPKFAKRVCRDMNARLQNEGLDVKIKETEHHFQAQNTMRGLLTLNAALRTLALDLYKIVNDIALMNSGPIAGLGEIELPELQPGSSIMPGKVNPVIPEAVKQVAARVIGNDATVAFAASDGYFELITMWPIATYVTLESISILSHGAVALVKKCIMGGQFIPGKGYVGIRATKKGSELVKRCLMLATALTPYIGYKEAAEVVHEAMQRGLSIKEIAKEKTGLSDEELDRILDITKMV